MPKNGAKSENFRLLTRSLFYNLVSEAQDNSDKAFIESDKTLFYLN